MARRRSLRARLTTALVTVSLGVLAVSAALTYLLVQATAESATVDDLEDQATEIAQRLGTIGPLIERGEVDEIREALRFAALITRIGDARMVFVAPDGGIHEGFETRQGEFLQSTGLDVLRAFSLPDALARDDLDGLALLAGEQDSGVTGSTAFVARALGPAPASAPNVLVLVVTDEVTTGGVGRAGAFFLVAAGLALLVVSGFAALIARRLTLPLRAAGDTATAIADGELSARVPDDPRADREMAQLGSTLNAMADQLERSRGAERAFLLSVSHDLRTPLTSIRGYAEALTDGTIDPSNPTALTHAAGVIESEARRLERLVRDLLDLARLDAREFSLHPRPVDAAAVVADAVEAFRPAAAELGLALDVSADGPVPADLDAERLAQIVANLTENALKYARSQVRVAVRRDPQLAIEVTDDGPGIEVADRDRVFERLYTARGSTGRAVGTGLGLAIVRELAQAMGGAARVTPVAEGGTRFAVTLPV